MSKQNIAEPLLNSNTKPYRHGNVRFFALALLAFVQIANEYSFNNPQALQDTIQQQLDIGQTKFNWLYTAIALPNIVFAFVIGIIIDYFGIRISFLVLSIGLPISQLIVALGGVYKSYSTMLVGRLLFGIVGQSLIVAQACYVSFWFMGKQLALGLGLATTLPELGNAFNSFLTPIIYQHTQSLGPPLFTSVGLCVLAFFSACIVTYLDKRADQIDEKNNLRVITDTDEKTENMQFQQPEKIDCDDLKKFTCTYWLLCFIATIAIAEYIPFLDNVNTLLQKRFCFSQVTAGSNVMLTYLGVVMFGLPIGYLADKIGYKRYLIITGLSIYTLGHVILLAYPQCTATNIITHWCGASWGLFLLGIGYCFYANCVMPSIPLVVSKKVMGTAFGIMSVLENLVMAVYPLIAGAIIQSAPSDEIGYRHDSLFYSVSGLVGIALSIGLLFISPKDKRALDATSKEKVVRTVKLYPYQTDTERINKKYQKGVRQSSLKKGYYSDYIRGDEESQQDSQYQRKPKLQLQLGQYNQKQKNQSHSKQKHKHGKQKVKSAQQIDDNQGDASNEDETLKKPHYFVKKIQIQDSSQKSDLNEVKYITYEV